MVANGDIITLNVAPVLCTNKHDMPVNTGLLSIHVESMSKHDVHLPRYSCISGR